MPDALNFTVQSQQPVDVVTPQGAVQRAMRVTFHDPQTDVTDSVDVPIESYDAQPVKALIEARLLKIRAVHALGS